MEYSTLYKILLGDMKDDTMMISFNYYLGGDPCLIDFVVNWI